jgi:hypothetical protein
MLAYMRPWRPAAPSNKKSSLHEDPFYDEPEEINDDAMASYLI